MDQDNQRWLKKLEPEEEENKFHVAIAENGDPFQWLGAQVMKWGLCMAERMTDGGGKA